jgi:flagellar biosynthesis chaperone FliJ
MADTQSFLDNLKNLRLVTSVAFEYVQENRNQFVKDATASDVRQLERFISQIRTLVEQLEKEFNTLEYLIAQRPPNSVR